MRKLRDMCTKRPLNVVARATTFNGLFVLTQAWDQNVASADYIFSELFNIFPAVRISVDKLKTISKFLSLTQPHKSRDCLTPNSES